MLMKIRKNQTTTQMDNIRFSDIERLIDTQTQLIPTKKNEHDKETSYPTWITSVDPELECL